MLLRAKQSSMPRSYALQADLHSGIRSSRLRVPYGCHRTLKSGHEGTLENRPLG
jgi:hypothetical protein